MIAYRICGSKYKNDISGEGARKQTMNRWNSFGTPMLYTSDSPALCGVELHQVVHPRYAPKDYQLLEIFLPDVVPLEIDVDFFAANWPNDLATTQRIGDFFVAKKDFLILKVPSAWIFSCHNYLVNPEHPDFRKVNIRRVLPFGFHGKLFVE